MRLLILSFYFPPDISAGSFRTFALVEELLLRPNTEVAQIIVITTSPSRYKNYQPVVGPKVSNTRLKVIRIPTVSSMGGLFQQALSFALFFIKAQSEIKNHRFDIVYSSSSRLMTSVFGCIVGKKYRVPIYSDIRDLFVDTVSSMYPRVIIVFIAPFLKILEKFVFFNSDKINLVSPGFNNYVRAISPRTTTSNFTNGIDEFFFTNVKRDMSSTKQKKQKTIIYAGNIGKAQNLSEILINYFNSPHTNVCFLIFGSGSDEAKLKRMIKEMRLEKRIKVYPPVKQKELLKIYQNADALFLHLDRNSALEKVIPSKIFEYGASGKPIIAGLGGFPKKFFENRIAGFFPFDPCDHVGMSLAIERAFSYPPLFNRQNFIEEFSRKRIMKNLVDDILKLRKISNLALRRS